MNFLYEIIGKIIAKRPNLRIKESREHYYTIALLKQNENLRALNFLKSNKIKNSRKFTHVKITRSTVYSRA